MLCCVGLIGGMAVGQALGGPWTYVAPAVGFGIGLAGDMKFMKGMHGMGHRHDSGTQAKEDTEPVRGVGAGESKPHQRVADAGARGPAAAVSGAEVTEGTNAGERIKAAGGARATST